eukprot:COSAG01_NODE_63052_length_281_cov_1.401099_2_plen_27_part_01
MIYATCGGEHVFPGATGGSTAAPSPLC